VASIEANAICARFPTFLQLQVPFFSSRNRRVESHGYVSTFHLCVHEGLNQRIDHRRHLFTMILPACALHGVCDMIQLLLNHGKEQRMLIWEVLVQGAD
jgi:hypothetical protein